MYKSCTRPAKNISVCNYPSNKERMLRKIGFMNCRSETEKRMRLLKSRWMKSSKKTSKNKITCLIELSRGTNLLTMLDKLGMKTSINVKKYLN